MKKIRTANRLSLGAVILAATIGISPIASAADPRCGSSGVYFSHWPQEWDHTLLSKSSSGDYAATTVVTKKGSCFSCGLTTDEKRGPIPLPAGQYNLSNNKLLYWGRDRWIAIGNSVDPYWLAAPQLWSYENMLSIRSSPAMGGKGRCVIAQVRGVTDQLNAAGAASAEAGS